MQTRNADIVQRLDMAPHDLGRHPRFLGHRHIGGPRRQHEHMARAPRPGGPGAASGRDCG